MNAIRKSSNHSEYGSIGAATSVGFVAYYGSQLLKELLQKPQKEEITMEMGGQT